MSNTPVASSGSPPTVRVITLPEGYSRVWSGRINIGDLYLHWLKFWNEGEVEWVRLSAQKIIEDGPYYGEAEWFGCVIRERSEEKGYPCITCGISSPMPDLDLCCVCAQALYPSSVDDE